MFGALLILSFLSPSPIAEREDVIYGVDDREEILDVQNLHVSELARSSVSLVSGDQLRLNTVQAPNGDVDFVFDLSGAPLAQEQNLCPEERFRDQVRGSYCSGVLISPTRVATAGHCIVSQAQCQQTYFVFGFQLQQDRSTPTRFNPSQVYTCDRLIDRVQEVEGTDWAVIELERPVEGGRLPVKLSSQLASNPLPMGLSIFMLGNPAGIPLKHGKAWVREDIPGNLFFKTNLDNFFGGSGAAVYNSKTFELEGLVTKGEPEDFVLDSQRGCKVSKRCADDACMGEYVTKVSAFSTLRE
ncbi:S1 family peptidase [bacterium]|jgi:hypothetical protein|nr:S1 family peptidase [bacterium]